MDSLLFLECRFQPRSQGSPLPVLTERESRRENLGTRLCHFLILILILILIKLQDTLFDLWRVSCEKGFLFSEGRTGLFSPMRDYLFLFFLNPEFNKLFFVFRDQMVVRAPRKT